MKTNKILHRATITKYNARIREERWRQSEGVKVTERQGTKRERQRARDREYRTGRKKANTLIKTLYLEQLNFARSMGSKKSQA